ncbi:MAG: DNA translocase FtsK [Verrucomicrobia bacterium]|nr:DNA translocase FtsK [Verrucomicrobiota bacterium]
MARKDEAEQHHGWHDVIGIVLVAVALLLAIALFSYDRRDIGYNTTEVNRVKHNLIGAVGAWGGYGAFRLMGGAAYLLPLLLLGVGLGHLLKLLGYLRRRWPWGVVMMLACMGLLALYSDRLSLQLTADAGSAGGFIGMGLNGFFRMFGTVGATVIYATIYLVSIIFLTNFQFGQWFRTAWDNFFNKEAAAKDAALSPEERALQRKARELEAQAERLRKQVERAEKSAPEAKDERSGLGQDLQPVPEPTVRDLSITQAKPAVRKRGEKPAIALVPIEESGAEGEIIKADEIIGKASTADILGKKSAAEKEKDKDKDAEKSRGADSEKPEAPVSPEPAVAAAVTAPADATAKPTITDNSGSTARPQPKRKKPLTVASTPLIGNYQLPSVDLLNHAEPNLVPSETKEQLMERARLMQKTLAEFDIEVSLGDITKGPTITRYELHPVPGVKLEKITALSNNIAAALKAERINILAPVPGKSSVGVEVPNAVKTKVIMRDLLESEEWRTTKARIPLALGKDVYGHPIIADLGEMPHMLIAGSTGSGKSVCINSIVASLLYRFSPDQLRFVMIDPKVVELQQYNALPHLVVPVVTDPKKVILALRWVVNEMEKRYQIFARVGVRNISSFNGRPKDKPLPQSQPELPLSAKKEKVEAGADGFAVEVDEEIVVPRDEDIVIPEKLSYIVVIIDELADLMLVAPADVEMAIARITQMARAAGIHCIVATQRPSVDVITGVIKANIPARIAFQCASRVDSRTILDAMGADKLLGKGDMLFLPPGSAKLNRAQGALITDSELQGIVDFIAKQGKPSYEMDFHNALQKMQGSAGQSFDLEESGCGEDEKIIQDCIEVIRSEQKASVSLLQRRLRLGYGRAARIMDELEGRGIVGPNNGAEPREILIDLDGGGADGNAPTQPAANV